MRKHEEFEPPEELLEELAELTGNVKKSGGVRPGSGRKRKDGSEPIKRKATPKMVQASKESPRLEHDVSSKLSDAPAKGRGRPTKPEMKKEILDRLMDLGFDPVENMVNMCMDPELYGLDGKDLIKINSEFMGYIHGKKKSIEKKEEHSYRIEVVRKDFRLDDKGEVVDI
jgi:hypothetical protein